MDKLLGCGCNDLQRDIDNLRKYNMQLVMGNVSLIDSWLDAGFKKENIRIGLSEETYKSDVDISISKGVYEFYIDEPIRWNKHEFVKKSSEYIAEKGGFLTISESCFSPFDWWFRRSKSTIAQMLKLAKQCKVHPYVSCHTHYDLFCKIPFTNIRIYSSFPISNLKYLKKHCPQYFRSAWIKVCQTKSEMIKLFNKLNELGINQVLFYPCVLYDYVPERMEEAIEAAIETGWIK